MRSPSEKGPDPANQVQIKKKEEKELGVGAYITACLLTKPSCSFAEIPPSGKLRS